MQSLREISAREITKTLSEDARQQLFGHFWMPYLEDIVEVLHSKDMINLLSEFEHDFPELIQFYNEDMMSVLSDFEHDFLERIQYYNKHQWIAVQDDDGTTALLYRRSSGGCGLIRSKIPFNMERNNRLIQFCLSHNLSPFPGVRRLILPSTLQTTKQIQQIEVQPDDGL